MSSLIYHFKSFVRRIATSDLTYLLLIRPRITNSCIKTPKGLINVEKQTRFIQSLLFWGLHENSERKLIDNYLKTDLPVIELGASIGMTMLTICRKVNRIVKVISIEANVLLIPNLNKTKAINGLTNLEIQNAAIDYKERSHVPFFIDPRILGSMKSADESNVTVSSITLKKILGAADIDKFTLVCDIEGAEAEMFICEEKSVFDKCVQVIIELHDITYNGTLFTKSDLVQLICEKINGHVVVTRGATWVFEKN